MSLILESEFELTGKISTLQRTNTIFINDITILFCIKFSLKRCRLCKGHTWEKDALTLIFKEFKKIKRHKEKLMRASAQTFSSTFPK